MKTKYIKRVIFASLILLLSSCSSKYKIIYLDFNNNSKIEKIKIKDHADIDNLVIPEYLGYSFSAFYLDPNLSRLYDSSIPIEEIKALYAKWIKLETSSEYSFLEVYNQALNNHLSSNNYSVTTRGEANAVAANQKIYSRKKVEGDYLYLFNASYGLAKTYVILESNKEIFSLEVGKPDKDFNPKTMDYKKDITLSEYISIFGVNPYELNYLINEQSLKEIITKKESQETYIFTVTLDDSAAVNYKEYIKGINSFESKNVLFEAIEIEFTITKDFYFSQIKYNEVYTVEVKLPLIGFSKQKIKNTLVETYNYN